MSWLKSLNVKRFLKLPGRDSAEAKHRFSLPIPWNQTTKVMTGLLASVFSMMALITFFGSLEPSESINASLSEETDLGFELGDSDELSLEFGLNANLPTGAPESGKESHPPTSVIKAVSVQQVAGTVQDDANVYHAVGQDFEGQQSGRQVKQIAGERPVYINSLRPAGNSSRSRDSGAVWLTGEIEETDDLPVNGSARRVRKY
ncbi:MAG: hypothetical protein K0U86_13685 [Planctomycetes bacterium]|nr:hypothetical protein [Planctomycetota bacterium]MCH9725944.1 hypothetical protein [Planctomycetota bacterium]MCH9777097.1 hypothetical protein [Planctomycetota bacterium]MCH9792164.1 hypothetical protein [Planctomycetota bacterium]